MSSSSEVESKNIENNLGKSDPFIMSIPSHSLLEDFGDLWSHLEGDENLLPAVPEQGGCGEPMIDFGDSLPQPSYPSPNYESESGLSPSYSMEDDMLASPESTSDSNPLQEMQAVSFADLMDCDDAGDDAQGDKEAKEDSIDELFGDCFDIAVKNALACESSDSLEVNNNENKGSEGCGDDSSDDSEDVDKVPVFKGYSLRVNLRPRQAEGATNVASQQSLQSDSPLRSTDGKDLKVNATARNVPDRNALASPSQVIVVKPAKSTVSLPKTMQVVESTRSTSPTSSAGTFDIDDSLMDKHNKGAMQARVNREKKKAYVKGLERQVSSLTKENDILNASQGQLEKHMVSLQEEVAYLRNVLDNDSALSGLLSNIGNVQGVTLTSSFVADRKRSMSSELDHDYGKPSKRGKRSGATSRDRQMSGGVCLHVDNDNVSLEFCSKCAKMAKGGPRSQMTS